MNNWRKNGTRPIVDILDLLVFFYLLRTDYEWKTFFRTTVSIPPLLGQPYQIQPYGSPRANENLQMITDNDVGSDYIHVCDRDLRGPSPKIDLQDDYFGLTS